MPHSRVVFVDVYIDDPATDPPQFRVKPSLKNDPQLPMRPNPSNSDLPVIIFGNDRHPGFVIHFELKGDTHGYFFPAAAADALWSQTGSACPNVTGVWNVFSPIEVYSCGFPEERRVLMARNLNPPIGGGKGQGNFMYNLRVTNGTRTINLDPPGDNTNGPSRFLLTMETFLVAGAAATAAFFAVTEMVPGLVGDGNASLGTGLLAALTVGFAIAALWERVRRS